MLLNRPATFTIESAETFRRSLHQAVLLTNNIIQKRHGRVLTKTHAKKFRIYDLRHTYLTRLGESGADAFTIMKLAGHVSIETTQRYVHPTPERMETAMGNLEKYNQRQSERAATRKRAS